MKVCGRELQAGDRWRGQRSKTESESRHCPRLWAKHPLVGGDGVDKSNYSLSAGRVESSVKKNKSRVCRLVPGSCLRSGGQENLPMEVAFDTGLILLTIFSH